MIKLEDKEKYLNKFWVRYSKKKTRYGTTTKSSYFLIYDIVEGKMSGDTQLYGIKALEYTNLNDKSDTHFTNSTANYRKWKPLFFERMQLVEDSDIFSDICISMITELFEGKRGIEFFEEKYRIKNIL